MADLVRKSEWDENIHSIDRQPTAPIGPGEICSFLLRGSRYPQLLTRTIIEELIPSA